MPAIRLDVFGMIKYSIISLSKKKKKINKFPLFFLTKFTALCAKNIEEDGDVLSVI